MGTNILISLSLCLLGIFIQGCQTIENVLDVTTEHESDITTENVPDGMSPLPDPHNHVVDVNETRFDQQNLVDFKIVPVSVESGLRRENIINQNKTFQAFSTCDEAACRIFYEELNTGQTYEIQGLPLPHRPFSDLIWVTNEILVFDRWSQPHYGIHYAVDVSEQRLLLASPFPDLLPQE